MFSTLDPSYSLLYPISRILAGRATKMICKFRMNDKSPVFSRWAGHFSCRPEHDLGCAAPTQYLQYKLFITIRVPCLTDWFHCLLLACLVVNILIIWVVTFSPGFFYLFVQMAYRFSVWLPLLLPSFSVVFLAAQVSLPFEVYRYNTGAHLTLRDSKVLLLGRIRPLQMYWVPRFYCDGTNLVTRLDINP